MLMGSDKATVCMEGIRGAIRKVWQSSPATMTTARRSAAANNPAYAKTIFIGFDGNITAAQSILDGGETMTAQSGYD